MARKGEKKQKKSILDRIGVKAKKLPTENEVAAGDRREQMIMAWEFVRDRIDKGCSEYLVTGESETLKAYVGRPARDHLIRHLEDLRQRGVRWAQPDRSTRTNPRYEISGEQLASDGALHKFVVEERFNDNSIYAYADGSPQAQCPGRERVIQGEIEVESGTVYRLIAVTEVQGATLGE